MILSFLRHAEAEPSAESDFERRLTTRGLAQAAKAGKFLRRAGLVPDVILTSPVVRALQMANQLDRAPIESSWLACGMKTETLLRELFPHLEKSAVLLVGHEPDFSEAIGALLGAAPQAIRIRKASLTALELQEAKPASAELQFLIPARLM